MSACRTGCGPRDGACIWLMKAATPGLYTAQELSQPVLGSVALTNCSCLHMCWHVSCLCSWVRDSSHTTMESQNTPKSGKRQCTGVYLEFGQILSVMEVIESESPL